MSSGASAALSCALRSGQPLPDSLIISYLEELQVGPKQPSTEGAAEHLQVSKCGDGSSAMMLARREQTIRATGDRLAPSAFVLNPGGKVVLAVAQGPPQAFYISKDAEDRFVTPTIPQGTTYEWTPAGPGRYTVQSEVYPHLRSTIQVLQETQQEEATAVPAPGEIATARRRRTSSMLGSSAPGSSLADELSSSSRGASAVDESISFPALTAARPAGWSGSNNTSSSGMLSRATQTAGGGTATVTRHTSTSTVSPGMVLGRFAQAAEDDDDDEFDLEAAEGPGSLLEAPAGSGLRRRPRSSGAPLPGAHPGAGRPSVTETQQQQLPTGVLPPLKQAQPAGLAGRESFSVLSSGSGSSPRSGSERSGFSSAPPLMVQRRMPGGMLQTTHAYPSAAARSVYSDSLSGGSDEKQPLLFNVAGSRSGQGPLHSPSYGSSTGSFRPYPAAMPPHMHRPQEDRAPTPLKCPRCRKEYLSTINQRRCISSHLGSGRAGRGAGGGGSVPDSSQLAAFWDELDEGEKRAVMDLRGELNGEMLMRQLEIQKLHRQRSGAMDQLTQEQKRLHTSGLLLHSACEGGRGGAGVAAAIQRLTGANLMRVLSEVSEGTFLADRNPISQEEFHTGNNLEAGLGALVMKRLVDAHLAAKQRQADRLQRELEDQEAAQQVQKAGKKKLKAKAKGKAVAATALPAGKPASKAAPAPAPAPAAAAPAPAAAAAAAPDSHDGAVPDAADAPQQQQQQPAATQGQQQQQQPAAAEQPSGTAAAAAAVPPAADVLSPPRPGGSERYGASPVKPSTGGPASRSSFTNFLFAEEGEAQPVAVAGARAETANGWRLAGNGRASRIPAHPAGPPKAGRSSSSSRAPPPLPAAAAPAAAAGAAPKGTARGSGRSSSSSVPQPERPSSRIAVERAAPAIGSAAPAAVAPAPKTAAAPSNGKLSAVGANGRQQASGATAPVAGSKPQQQQAALPSKDSFPALPAATGGMPAAAAASGGAPRASFSYAAAASKSRKEGGKGAALAPKSEPAAAPRQQQQQQQPVVASSLSQQPQSWPVPGAGAGAAPPAAAAPAGSVAAASTAAPAASSAQPAPAPAPAAGQQPAPAQLQAPAASAASPPAAAAFVQAAPPAQVPAAAWEAAAAGQPAAAEDAQRCASVTPPISDAGSPPQHVLMPPSGAFSMPPGWPVGMDGAPLPPPPMGFYWMVAPPLPPPGMQYGSGELQYGSGEAGEGMGPGPGPYMNSPYPFYPHAPYPVMPPGHPGAGGMPMPMPHMLPYDGQLAPFPPGMPVPMSHEAAEQLAPQQAGSWGAAGPEPAGAAAEPEEEQALTDAEQPACTAAAVEEPFAAAAAEHAEEQQAEEQQQVQAPAANDGSSGGPAGSSRKRSSFLEMLQEACGVPAAAQLLPAAPAPGGGRRRGAPRTPPAFDAAAAAAELDRRWKAAAPRSVPASSLPTISTGAAEAAAAVAAAPAPQRPDRRSSGGGTVSSKAAGAPAGGGTAGQASSKPSLKVPGSGGGRNSPAAGAKPVVVAVRAWSSSEESAHADSQAGPKWRIQAAAAAAAAAAAKQQPQVQQ